MGKLQPDDLWRFLVKNLGFVDARLIEDFILSKEFSSQGRLIIAEVFIVSLSAGCSINQVMAAVDEIWHEYWQWQLPETRADPLDKEADKNVAALGRVYDRLKLPNPTARLS